MQNRKQYIVLGVAIVVVGIAAFTAGRILNRGVNPLSLFGFAGEGDGISILPAEELPKMQPAVEGLFVGRQDNMIFVETNPPGGDGVSGAPVGLGGGRKFEVVVTTETILYRDTTQPPARRPSGDDPRELQQIVEEGTLDDLNDSQSLVMVWGRKSGDRIVAEVLLYIDLVTIEKP
ncbi:MAG TPA: hypothetical protein VKE92_15585 [Anaerolineales bacterium]|nr:hypothetical protein [Anaerolineales bacterium]